MSRYVDRRGGLTVEKTDPVKTTENASVSKNKVSIVSGEEAVETIQSYQASMFANTDSSAKGVCKICGISTAYKNRHICVECWKKHKNEIIQGIKTAVNDVEFKIQ